MTSCKELPTKHHTVKKKRLFFLHSEVDWSLKETVMSSLRKCTHSEVCYQIA